MSLRRARTHAGTLHTRKLHDTPRIQIISQAAACISSLTAKATRYVFFSTQKTTRNKRSGTFLLEHFCWNIFVGTFLLEHFCWNIFVGTFLLEHFCSTLVCFVKFDGTPHPAFHVTKCVRIRCMQSCVDHLNNVCVIHEII